jgi:uncharacterized membrane protein YedE/YeeE
VVAALEGEPMTAAVASLLIGLVLGYLGQRSRMCFVGGLRDFILVRDTALLKGLLAFALAAWVAFPLARIVTGVALDPPIGADVVTVLLTIAGGFGVGYVSTLANGCPLRQHVLAAQGVTSALTYLAGFFAGAIVFHVWVAPVLVRLLP